MCAHELQSWACLARENNKYTLFAPILAVKKSDSCFVFSLSSKQTNSLIEMSNQLGRVARPRSSCRLHRHRPLQQTRLALHAIKCIRDMNTIAEHCGRRRPTRQSSWTRCRHPLPALQLSHSNYNNSSNNNNSKCLFLITQYLRMLFVHSGK